MNVFVLQKPAAYPDTLYIARAAPDTSLAPVESWEEMTGEALKAWAQAEKAAGWTPQPVPLSAEEQARIADDAADATEADQLRTIYTALKNGTGTSGERLQRLERACAFLLKCEAKRRGLTVS